MFYVEVCHLFFSLTGICSDLNHVNHPHTVSVSQPVCGYQAVRRSFKGLIKNMSASAADDR